MPPRKSKRVAKKAKAGPPEAEDHVEVQSAVVEGPFIFQPQFLQQLTACTPQIAAFLGVSARAEPTRCVAFFAFVCQSQPFFYSDGNGCLIHQQSVLTVQDGRMQLRGVGCSSSVFQRWYCSCGGTDGKASEPGIYIPWHSRSLSDRF